MDQRAMKDAEMNADDIHDMTATDYVTRGSEDDEDWEVDFEYVARGYLSWKVPYVLNYMKDEELVAAANLIRNFLNYVPAPPPRIQKDYCLLTDYTGPLP